MLRLSSALSIYVISVIFKNYEMSLISFWCNFQPLDRRFYNLMKNISLNLNLNLLSHLI